MTREGKDYRMPPASDVPTNLSGLHVIPVESYGVGSWCPLPDGKGPATQVLFHYTLRGMPGAMFALRLKSAGETDRLIAMLRRHRADVWPDVPPTEV